MTDQPHPKRHNTPPHTKKVFDVVRPGKALASPTSRPVITGRKPLVADDQFVAGPHSRLAGDPNEERPLMDPSKKLDLAPTPPKSESAATDAPSFSESPEEAMKQPEPQVSDDATVPEPTAEAAPELPAHEDATPTPVFKTEAEPAKPTPQNLAVQQSVQAEIPAAEPGTPAAAQHEQGNNEFLKPLTSDDILADTDAPLLEHAVVSHHKQKMGFWKWLLVIVTILLLAVAALDLLLDAGVVTTELDIPYTNIIQQSD